MYKTMDAASCDLTSMRNAWLQPEDDCEEDEEWEKDNDDYGYEAYEASIEEDPCLYDNI